MSRTGNPSNLFPKSKGKLDDAEMEMDDLDEDQANVDDDGEEIDEAAGSATGDCSAENLTASAEAAIAADGCGSSIEATSAMRD